MKFSDLEKQQWDELKPYLDTCLLPITGLTGKENPWEATEALERLRDVMDKLEIPYKGRIVTYPAFHYRSGGESMSVWLECLCKNIKETGFRFVFLISADLKTEEQRVPSADLFITNALVQSGVYRSAVERVWSGNSGG